MIVLTAEERAAAKWLKRHGVSVAEPATLLTARLSPRGGKKVPEAFLPVFAVTALVAAGAFAYPFLRLLPGVDGTDLPVGAYAVIPAVLVATTALLHRRAGDRRAAVQLGARGLDRRPPPWREVVGGWYVTSLAITFGGGAVLALALAWGGSLWAVFWLVLLAIGALADGVLLAWIIRRPVLAEDEGSLAVDVVTRLEDVHHTMPSSFAVAVVFDLIAGNPPGRPWLIGYVVLAVATHVLALFTQRARVPALPADGHYGVPA
ncbi:hypothetical protein [Amycolatopsis kentuckyensis]|uniref:hypothetical protein n=1 Tax=Amycolatopsis kentuckyensis TaxID=218823 RepID=UPI003564D6EE